MTKRLFLFCGLFIVLAIGIYSILLYVNSPQYKYLQKIKKNPGKINVFFSYTMIRQTGGGIPIVAYDLYSALQKREDINLYSQSSEMIYRRKNIPYFLICKLIDYKDVSNKIIQNTDIFFSIHPDDFTIKIFKNSNKTKKNIKYYTIVHDVHMAIQYLDEVKDIQKHKSEEERVSLLRAEKADDAYRFFDLDKMDGIFVISNVTKKDTEAFFPETKKVPKYLSYWPIPTRNINSDLYYNNKKIFGNKKMMQEQNKSVQNFINQNKLYIITSLSKNFYPIYIAVKKINEKYPNLNLKLVFTSHKGGMPEMYKMKSYMELAKNFKLDENCFHAGLLTNENLELLMRKSTAFVSNNFYEGYGLETVYAMQNGMPIILNDVGSNKEIAGNGAYIVKNKKGCKLLPYFSAPFLAKDICEEDEEDLYNAIEKVVIDKNFRAKLIESGKKEMKNRDLSWDKLANSMILVWKKDLKGASLAH